MTEIKDVDFIAIHSAATKAWQDITEEDVREWHLAKGWSDIGYHIFIRRDGTIEFGRPFDVRGAHVLGHNDNSIGICVAGGIDNYDQPEDNFTDKQYHALLRVLDALKMLWPRAQVKGHRDFDGTSTDCPSFDVRVWLNNQGRGHYAA